VNTGMVKKPITKRQIRLQKMSISNGWSFERDVDWNTSYLRNFKFFDSRPIEMKSNSIKGFDKESGANWEIADIVFDEGALVALEIYQTTVQIIILPSKIPKFIIDKEGLFDKIFHRVRVFSGASLDTEFMKDIGFSGEFLLSGDDEDAIKSFFNDELIRYLEQSDIHHIESTGEALMIFKYLHIARSDEVQNMLDFSSNLLKNMRLKGPS